MKKYHRQKHTTARAGLTLLELMTAISISAIIVTLVLASWDYINRHVINQEYKGYLRDETARVTTEISQSLKRTTSLLKAATNSVTLVNHLSGDTVEYAFDGESLTKNGTPMPFNVHGGKITSFTVSDITEGDSEYMLLEITVTSEDTRNFSDTSRVIVNAKKGAAVFEDGGFGF